MAKRSRDTDDIPSRNVKAKHTSMSTASTKEGDLRDATELKRQDSMDSTQSQYPDKEATLSRSASDSLTVYKRGLEKMDLDQSVKNIDALEVEVAKRVMTQVELAKDYTAQVKKTREIVKVKKALKQELKAVKDENEEVKGSLYTLTLRCNELKEQLEKAQKESRYWYDSYGEAYDDYTREWDCADKARKQLENAKKMERKQQHLIKRLEKDLDEDRHLIDFQAFISKGQMEALQQENEKLKADLLHEKEESAMEIASQQMDIENFHAVATEARAEAEFATTAKDALHKQLQKTEAKLIEALDEVIEAQQERDQLRRLGGGGGIVRHWHIADADTSVPGAFIRLKGINAEGKTELWYGQIDKVNPADLSITVARYFEEAETTNGSFLMMPSKASAGKPLKNQWIHTSAYQVIVHFPVSEESADLSMKAACEYTGWGPFDNCDQHTEEQHAAMRMEQH